ncbi:hybrid sensor histidine kinase/response regulator [Aquimarina litoralis]|uniref:hybrid sensor histidine kinase/response regulator n=1 Tax=Aquimarina litoralis TaxID=584605 RepID=UPI001C5A1EA5|nr:two-component regulator propeller domain-containing protein [Aquimarina litoralis]MBW1296193.1 response regulator [Aquimarina litoralis]
MKYIYCALLLFFTSTVSTAQDDFYNKFLHLFTSDGLSQSSVIAIHQDRLEQMWIGTRDGLNKYDGNNFTVYRNIPNDSTSISNNDILSIQEDQEGFIWIGTYNGLNRYDPKQNVFKSYFHSSKEGSLSDNTIWTMKMLDNGELWFGSSNGLMVYNRGSDSFTIIKNDAADTSSLSNNYILSIYQDKKKDIWIGTANGLNKLKTRNKETFVFERFYSSNKSNTLSDSYIQAIVEDDQNRLWIGTKYGGLNFYNSQTNSFKQIRRTRKNQLINKDVRSLSIDNRGVLWIATYDGLCIKNNDDSVIKIKHQQNNLKSLSRNSVKTIFIDKKGSTWLGTYYGGINIWDESNSNFISLQKNNNDIEYGVVSSIIQDKNNNIYFGTEGKGISILNPKRNASFDIQTISKNKLPSLNIKSLYLNEEILWIGTYNAGIALFDTNSKEFITNRLSKDLQTLLQEVGVYAIERSDNFMYFGTFGKGLIQYDLDTKQFRFIAHSDIDKKSLSNDIIRIMLVDSNSNLWIGTQNGLNYIENSKLEDEKVVVKRYFFNEEQLSGDDILCIYEDSKGVIYIGTKANGVYKFENETFQRVELNVVGTKISTVFSIVEYEENSIWISSNKGIIAYNPKKETSILYNQTDGLISNEFNNNSCLKAKNGDLYFGGPSGVSFLNPKRIKKNTFIPQVVLTDFNVQGKNIDTYGKGAVLKQSISYTDKLSLAHDQASFGIGFAIPNFINPSNNHYAYRLVGLDDQWQYTKNTEINYTIQKAGKYTFEVKGANNDNIWNETPTQLQILVKPAPWKSPIAFAGYALMIALALFGLNHINKARTKLKHELDLEHLENIRKEEMNRSKLEFFTNISHEFRTPLALIIAPLQQLIENYQGSNKMYKRLLVIERNADQLLKLINQLLDFRKFENKHSKLQVAEGNLVKYLKEIYLSFNEFAKAGSYTYTFEASSDKINVYFDRYKLERVFYNLISNAFKYTPEGGEINVNIFEKDNQVVIEIKDNGKGIEKEFVDKVFDRFYEVAGDKDYQKQFNQASGIGLSIAKKAIDLHKGTIEVVDTNVEKGTVFRVSLLIGKSHLEEADIIKDFKISDDISQYENQISIAKENKELDMEMVFEDDEKPLILIAEDNDELRNFIGDMLKDYYQVIKAEDGQIAFKKALQKMPDLIISDVIMPKMEGTELCAKIKSDIRTSHIPFILLTSRTSLIYKFDGLESGADAYINKPFNVKEFLLTIRNLLSSIEKQKEKFSSNDFKSSDLTVTSVDEELLKKAVRIVEENISNTSFDIPYFSSELGVSRTMLFSKIKGWTNLTPNEFIHSIRMKRASQLLELGQINISEVCYKVGFRNPKYFTKCFKKHFNQTPSEYASKFYS